MKEIFFAKVKKKYKKAGKGRRKLEDDQIKNELYKVAKGILKLEIPIKKQYSF